ncbi:MAG: Rrf2 family transcriptional regulator [Atopobiaceae bacterium]|nr:Rrf2 family transcriptional regulator [Atopobiaceae bacterium]
MISTKGRYAIRVVIDIAEQDKGTRVPLGDVAERQAMSEKYLQRIAKSLVEAGLLVGVGGRGGGYALARPAKSISVFEVIRAAEGSLASVACLEKGAEPCERAQNCKALRLWRGLDKMTRSYLEGVTVADLVDTNTAEAD